MEMIRSSAPVPGAIRPWAEPHKSVTRGLPPGEGSRRFELSLAECGTRSLPRGSWHQEPQFAALRSAWNESWRTLLQCFRIKIFLATSDEFTARNAAELCGRRDRLKAHYSVSASGGDAHISLPTGRSTSATQSLTHHEHIFAPGVFTQTPERAGDRIALRCINPRPP
jgi:hypothetical protein